MKFLLVKKEDNFKRKWLAANGAQKALHHPATAPFLAANLLEATGNREGVEVLTLLAEEGQQPLHPAEVRPIGVNATAAITGVEMAAPAIRSDQIHVGGPLLGVKGRQGFAPAFGIEATTGAAATDALPGG